MPLLFTIVIRTLLLLGLALPFSRLFWPEVIEGQVGKQSFVAHMIESWMRGDADRGFPVRWFVEPWHPGPVAWAEEVPFFHLIASSIGRLFGMTPAQAGRVSSFLFALLLVWSVRGLARLLFPARPPSLSEPVSPSTRAAIVAVALAPVLLVWMPGFQIYASSVIPDLAMLALIAFAYWLRLNPDRGSPAHPSPAAYVALLLACLLKYFAVFALLALLVYDCLADRDPRTRLKSRATALFWSVIAGLPTLAYLYYFISKGIPNPITEYREANGYGHLAGPFLLEGRFYARFLTWTLVKNPTIVWAIAALAGVVHAWRWRRAPTRAPERDMSDLHPGAWRLIHLHTAAYALFALAFASAFYVHDYYALPFVLPAVFYAAYPLSGLWVTGRARRALAAAGLAGGIALGFLLSQDATFRLTNYLKAGEWVRATLEDVPDRDSQHLTIFVSDFSQPVIPMLSRKAGWAFNATQLTAQRERLIERLGSRALRAIVFYVREPDGDALIDEWRAADPRLSAAAVAADQSWPSEGKKGSATRLLILRPR